MIKTSKIQAKYRTNYHANFNLILFWKIIEKIYWIDLDKVKWIKQSFSVLYCLKGIIVWLYIQCWPSYERKCICSDRKHWNCFCDNFIMDSIYLKLIRHHAVNSSQTFNPAAVSKISWKQMKGEQWDNHHILQPDEQPVKKCVGIVQFW